LAAAPRLLAAAPRRPGLQTARIDRRLVAEVDNVCTLRCEAPHLQGDTLKQFLLAQ
jgi:hypothetical protein